MKQPLLEQWTRLSDKLDAMTLRERAMVFAAMVAAILFVMYTLSVEPLLAKQRLLQLQIKLQNNQIAGIDAEISAKAAAFTVDPDAPVRAQLKAVQQDIDRTSAGLMAVQKGLVPQEKIVSLLDHILRGNGKLKLISMRTLPTTGLSDTKPAVVDAALKPTVAAPPLATLSAAAAGVVPTAAVVLPGATPKPRELLYRHGVEIVLQGGYLDMVNYMAALEALPVQLFWGKAKLDAQQYPNSRLTLTLYTLSLDSKWMKL